MLGRTAKGKEVWIRSRIRIRSRMRRSVNRGCPFGDEEWVTTTVKELELESTMRPLGRPPKAAQAAEEA